MKKSLLLGCAMLAATQAFAAVPSDGCTYETKDGITMTSIWAMGREINTADFNALFEPNGMMGAYARRATSYDGKIYIPVGLTTTEGEGDDAKTSYSWTLVTVDLYTGELISNIPLTLNGEPVNALLGLMNMGFDDYGHPWMCGYFGGTEKRLDLPIYTVDLATGALTELPAIEWPTDEIAEMFRMDYPDITGDITATEGDAYFIGNGSGDTFGVCRFVLPQGGEAWEPGMEGYATWMSTDVVAFPESAAGWGDSPTAIFAKGCNDIFYANGSNTDPTQYSCAGGMPELLGSFGDTDENCIPVKAGCGGAWEFTIGDKMYLAYPSGQGADGGRFKVARMGGNADGGTFQGMELFWDVPSEDKAFITVSNDAQGRIHPVIPNYVKDSNGKEGVYLMSFFGKAELAVYLVAEEGFNANDGVEGIEADNNSAAEYFNLQGIRVANPENGLYIVRQGNKVSKVIR